MHMRAKRIAFICIALIWLASDQLSKLALAGVAEGEVLYRSPVGLFDIVLVHNTGAAWGMFSGAQAVLGVVSVLVCACIAIYVLGFAKRIPWVGAIGLSLVFAGGIGNAIDRFWHGYVIDFISCAFVDFPVFNVADIGVTVGVVLFIISILIEGREVSDGTADQPHCN